MQDHVNPDLLFIGTEFGVWFSVDGGGHWVKLSGNAPTIPFRDLVIQKRENDLVGATFGRSFYVLDDYTPLRSVDEELLGQEAALFPVRKAWWYIERRSLGFGEKAAQGDAFFTAPNPPFGAVFTYYLSEGMKSRKTIRQEAEKKIAEEGGDTPYPGWEELRREELEEEPAILLTVTDSRGDIVRRLTGPADAGFHRVAWDLRYPDPSAWRAQEEDEWLERKGPLAAPGRYTVTLAKRMSGVVSELGQSQSFDVVPLRERSQPGASPAEVVAFGRELAELSRRMDGADAAIEAALQRVGAIRESLMRSTASDVSLGDEARALELGLEEMNEQLNGNQTRDSAGDPGPVSIAARVNVAWSGNFLSTYGPTPTHLRSVEIAQSQLVELSDRLDAILTVDLPALEEKLEAAGVPWTPGRSVPGSR